MKICKSCRCIQEDSNKYCQVCGGNVFEALVPQDSDGRAPEADKPETGEKVLLCVAYILPIAAFVLGLIKLFSARKSGWKAHFYNLHLIQAVIIGFARLMFLLPAEFLVRVMDRYAKFYYWAGLTEYKWAAVMRPVSAVLFLIIFIAVYTPVVIGIIRVIRNSDKPTPPFGLFFK